ncbi:MAG TPA: TIR domain-containing protein, partial [Rubrivivax sp.]|nr:TIR domain-containing protein [Rubrivivax sp.]
MQPEARMGLDATAGARCNTPAVTRSVFISYSHTDRSAVRRDAELLRASGVQIFIDVHDIAYGERWAEVLHQALLQCERVLVFWSRSALVSAWVEREWRFALSLGKKIVPTLLDTTPLPVELAEFQAVTRYRRRPRAVQPGQGPPPSPPAAIASQPAAATRAAPQTPASAATEAARPRHAAPSAPVWTEHSVASAAGRPGIAIPPDFDRDRRGATAGPFSRTGGWGAGATLAAGAGVGLWWLIEAPEDAPPVTVAAGPLEPAGPAAAPPGSMPVPSPAPDPVVAAAPVQGRPAVRPEGPVDAVGPTAPPTSGPTQTPAPSPSAAPAPATAPSAPASAPSAGLPGSRWLAPAALTLSLAGLLG